MSMTWSAPLPPVHSHAKPPFGLVSTVDDMISAKRAHGAAHAMD
ncbi:hypothetical protein O206_19775 [Ochrobactrum sp. EGD-AQ16]|nr:hypothetical protein O206_19775 [Ochrobactrum sp. EGD-AQ16]